MPNNNMQVDPSAPISHAAPLVPAVVLRADGELSLQKVRMPADVNMHRKAGLKTPTGGFGRVHACAGLWPGWYLWARPGNEKTEEEGGGGGVGAVVGPAVFLALDAPPPDAETVLDPCPDRTTVDAVRRMRAGEPPPPAQAPPAATPPPPPPPPVAAVPSPPLPALEAAGAPAKRRRKPNKTASSSTKEAAASGAVRAAKKTAAAPAAAAAARKKKAAAAAAALLPRQTLADFSALQPEPYEEE